ncbi:Bzip transcription factor [Phytophthora cinnamomi]|uniref:Bzip transcription factor n=1 Tax=Phytophthora cinnamomi TaxID=4785 RepID=UPI003559485C|nr:Bzip transcription factor [Phytophthora cinnamomi]
MPYGDEQVYYHSTLSQKRPSSDATSRTSQQREGRKSRARTDPTLQSAKMARRKERCRINQSRYRQRQREYLLSLEKGNAGLRKEIDGLMQVQQGGPYRDNGNGNTWCLVAKVFSFVQTSFQNPGILSESVGLSLIKSLLVELKFAPDIVMGSVSGVGGLMRQDRGNTDAQVSLGKRLLGQRITSQCSMSFVFDEVSSRVSYLEVNVDWITALLRLLGSMEDVANVLDGASITHEGVLGTSSEMCAGTKNAGIYMCAPFVAALLTWYALTKPKGATWYFDKFTPRIGVLTLMALLFTIIVLFAS